MTNLLYKASIVTTPTAYGVGVLNSIKPAQSFGEELVVNGSFNNGSTGWSAAGTTNASNYVEITENGARLVTDGTGVGIQQSVMVVGKKYKLTFDVTVATLGSAKFNGAFINFNSVGNYSTTFVATSTPLTYYRNSGAADITVNNVSLKEMIDADFQFSRNSSATRVNPDYLIETVATDIPRLDYTNGTASILLENQSTNLLPYSNDFSQWTSDTNASITSNSIISPDGTQNADKLIAGSSTARQAIKLNVTASGDISAYVFAKKGEYAVIQLTDAMLGSAFANFNLENGLVGSTNTFTANIENYGNGWFKCSITYNSVSSINSFRLSIAQSSTSARLVNFAGNNTDGLFIWGSQVEALTYPTSYIPTSGQSGGVTRAAETLNNAGNSDLINSTEGVLYAEISALSDDLTYRFISLYDGTSDNLVDIYYGDASNRISVRVRAGGGAVTDMFFAISDIMLFNKVAISWKLNEFKFFINGVSRGLNTSGAAPVGLDRLDFNQTSGSNPFYGKCKTVAVFSEALSDTELACLTSTNNREIFLNYYYRMQYVGANTEAVNCAQIKLNV